MSRLYWKADRLLGNFAVERDIIASLVFRDGLCHEIVMHFVYLTSEVVQSSLLRSPGFWLPTLPKERRAHGKHVIDAVVLKESCGPEHPDGDGKASEPSVECVQTAQGDEISKPRHGPGRCTWSDV